MFIASNGRPIVYQGKKLVMVDFFPTQGAKKLRLVFEQCNAEWRQGASLRIRKEGEILMNGQSVKHAVCWQDTAPQVVDFEVTKSAPALEVKNVWDVGDGVIESWHNGAAMMIEDLFNGRRYRCNDGFADDDFDDVIFRLERVL
jgi:hypothetical protein